MDITKSKHYKNIIIPTISTQYYILTLSENIWMHTFNALMKDINYLPYIQERDISENDIIIVYSKLKFIGLFQVSNNSNKKKHLFSQIKIFKNNGFDKYAIKIKCFTIFDRIIKIDDVYEFIQHKVGKSLSVFKNKYTKVENILMELPKNKKFDDLVNFLLCDDVVSDSPKSMSSNYSYDSSKSSKYSYDSSPKSISSNYSYDSSPKSMSSKYSYDSSPKSMSSKYSYDSRPKSMSSKYSYDSSPKSMSSKCSYDSINNVKSFGIIFYDKIQYLKYLINNNKILEKVFSGNLYLDIVKDYDYETYISNSLGNNDTYSSSPSINNNENDISDTEKEKDISNSLGNNDTYSSSPSINNNENDISDTDLNSDTEKEKDISDTNDISDTGDINDASEVYTSSDSYDSEDKEILDIIDIKELVECENGIIPILIRMCNPKLFSLDMSKGYFMNHVTLCSKCNIINNNNINLNLILQMNNMATNIISDEEYEYEYGIAYYQNLIRFPFEDGEPSTIYVNIINCEKLGYNNHLMLFGNIKKN